jgi:hypothetical protein
MNALITSLLSSLIILVPAAALSSTRATAADNLLPAQPAVNWWFPPYATAQPSWTDEGITVDLATAAGTAMAVLSIPSGTLTAGTTYDLRFEVSPDAAGDLIVVVPQAAAGGEKADSGKPRNLGLWGTHVAGAWSERASTFVYDPAVDMPDKIQVFWDAAAIATKNRWKFRNFSLTVH